MSSFADCVEQMVLSMHTKDEISPTLRVIVNQFDENNRRPPDFQFAGQMSTEEFDAAIDCDIGAEREEYENCQPWSDDHDDPTFVADLGSNEADPSFPGYPQVLLCFNPRTSTPVLDEILKRYSLQSFAIMLVNDGPF